MKFGAAFLISLTAAQDYGLDGADINDAAYSDNYNYDDKDQQNGGITLDDLSSLLADYYGGNTDYSIEDYNSALDELQSALGTTSSPVTIDAGRPDYDGGADEDAGKQFETFGAGALSAETLLGAEQTFCWTCNGSGANTAASLAACIAGGASKNCINEGEQDYCEVTLRRVNGEVKQIQSRCAQADTCDKIHNFHDPAAAKPNRWDHCLPETWDGNSWGNSKRLAGRESVCSICHYTSTTYGAGVNPGSVADATSSKLRFDGNNIQITGSTAGKTIVISDAGFDQEWGTQTNNVLDTIS